MARPAAGGTQDATPYSRLTPDIVIDALDSVGLRGDGRLIQLNSYENRVYQAFLEDGRAVVTKFYRPARWTDEQILEEHEFGNELAAAEIPVVPAMALAIDEYSRVPIELLGTPSTLARLTGEDSGHYRFAVAERHGGRAPELDDAETLQWIGRFIGRLHVVGAQKPFVHRQRFDVAQVRAASRDWLLEHRLVPDELEAEWKKTCDEALDASERAFDALPETRSLRLHGDCHLGNVLWTPAGPHFVDLDDACMGPAVQDLWMLLSGDRAAMTWQLGELLAGYEDFREFDWREMRLVEPLRTLRIVHHSAWLARRWNDPAFPVAFPWFGTTAYWGEQITRLQDQIDAMAEPALFQYG
ncbi:MAG: hypothetical protein JWQ11_4668 [Rhizobacter sp.]|nr:hypothetical protein [Rhizobacter sp.]